MSRVFLRLSSLSRRRGAACFRARVFCIALIVGIPFGTPRRAQANDDAWINPAGGDFHVASNWSTGSVPASTDSVTFDIPGSTPYVVNFTDPGTSSLVTTSGAPLTFSLTGAADQYEVTNPAASASTELLTVNNSLTATGGRLWVPIGQTVVDGPSASINVVGTSGTYQPNTYFYPNSLQVQNGASVNVSAGAFFNTQGQVNIGMSGAGTVHIDGLYTRWASSEINLGGSAGASGTLLVDNAASVNGGLNVVSVGSGAGSTGTLTVDGSWFQANTIIVGDRGTGTMNISSGSAAGRVSSASVFVGNHGGSSGNIVVNGSLQSEFLNIAYGPSGGGPGAYTGSLTLNSGSVNASNVIIGDTSPVSAGHGNLAINGGIMELDSFTLASGAATISSGTLVTAGETIGLAGAAANAILSQSGGTNSTWVITINQPPEGFHSTYTLSGGGLIGNVYNHDIFDFSSNIRPGGYVTNFATGTIFINPIPAPPGGSSSTTPDTLLIAANDGAIVVEPGAKLILNSGEIITSTPPTAFDGTVDVRANALLKTALIRQNTLSIEGTAQIGGFSEASSVHSLQIAGTLGAWTGKMDLGGGMVIYSPAGGPSSLLTIADQVRSGYANGAWTGTGIDSSLAAGAGKGKTAIGYAQASTLFDITGTQTATFEGLTVDPTDVLLRSTLYGDANLDGKVTFTDFVILSNHFGQSVPAGWSEGDFNYDGVVDFKDFVLLDNNISGLTAMQQQTMQSWAKDHFDTPEPSGLAMVGVFGMGILIRRRRVA
ncbi:MAG TPA: dockerin type I domain-containing protein [Tepidisphaeraceae bacterium]|nr:dockerin type I domain-containing protein [Tepidisphaeraceae bacterium]